MYLTGHWTVVTLLAEGKVNFWIVPFTDSTDSNVYILHCCDHRSDMKYAGMALILKGYNIHFWV